MSCAVSSSTRRAGTGAPWWWSTRWFASSKWCAACGARAGTLTLSARRWSCPDCAREQDRGVKHRGRGSAHPDAPGGHRGYARPWRRGGRSHRDRTRGRASANRPGGLSGVGNTATRCHGGIPNGPSSEEGFDDETDDASEDQAHHPFQEFELAANVGKFCAHFRTQLRGVTLMGCNRLGRGTGLLLIRSRRSQRICRPL